MSAVSLDIESQGENISKETEELLSIDDFDHIGGDVFEDVDLPRLYNMVWFKNRQYIEDDNKDFFHHYLEVIGNFDIHHPQDFNNEPPMTFRDQETIDEGFSIDPATEMQSLRNPHIE